MKKVLVFGMTENPGGVESVIMNYYRNIDRNKIQFDFLCNTEIVAYSDEIELLGGKIYKITSRRKNRFKFYKELNSFFKQHASEYEAIWVNVCSLANIDYLKYAKKYNIKKRIIHAHNSQNMDSFLRGLIHRLNRLIISKYATDYWTCSNEASMWFYSKKIIKSTKYLIVKNAIDLSKFKYNEIIRKKYRKELNLEGKIVFGNVARLHAEKNHIFLLKVFYRIQKKIKNSILVLVGDGEEKNKIENMIKKLGIKNKVILLGVRDDVSNLMQAMDAFIFPSNFEGLGIVAIEAQTAGLPVFASKYVIPKEVEIDKDIFNFIDLKEGEEYWATKIINVMSNIKIKRITRRSKIDLFIKKGYSIEEESKKIEKKLINK